MVSGALTAKEIRIALELSDPDFVPGFILNGKYYTVTQVGILPDETSWFYLDPVKSHIVQIWMHRTVNLLPQFRKKGKKPLHKI